MKISAILLCLCFAGSIATTEAATNPRQPTPTVPEPTTNEPTTEPATECPLDVVFLLDGSSSVGQANFEIVKNWVVTASSGFGIESGLVRIGVIQYSNSAITEVPLGSFYTKTALNNAITGIQYEGGGTATVSALEKSLSVFQGSTRWSDTSTHKILIVVTDGESHNPGLIPETSKNVRSQGIVPYAIGVGYYDHTELQIIATGNTGSNERVFTVKAFSELDEVWNKVRSKIEGDNCA